MNRVLNLQRLMIENQQENLGNSCSSSDHDCCNG
ncbi:MULTISPECIES: class III lanthipeptide [unclassified Stenotrophomonas]|jgi:hypothetical protein|nr:class III lanthipeptide [Stenotrophomonas sp. TD3]